MKFGVVSLTLVLLILNSACGGSKQAATGNGALSGNWQISLAGQTPAQPVIFTGFMLQTNNSVSGNLILGPSGNSTPCTGVNPIAGTVNGSNVSLSINQFEQEISLQGTSSPLAGQFSYQTGNCASSTDTGTWSAQQVQPLTGSFTGTFKSNVTQAVLPVNGTLTQGSNTGSSTATITGTMQATGNNFCPYISQATVSGLISGTTVELSLYGPNGDLITQLGNLGQLNNGCTAAACLLVTPDATSLTGSYTFAPISNACPADAGTLQFTVSPGQTSR